VILMTVFFLFTLLGCLFLVIYPYILFPAILRQLPAREIAHDAGHRCRVTLLFCAYNEGQVIAEKLRNIEMLKQRHPDLQVLAFDDGSTDDTAHHLSARPDLVTLVCGAGRSGKAHGMKLLAAQAQGEVMVFTDANVMLDDDALDNLMAWYADPQVGGVCGTLIYLGAGASTTATVGGLYWRLEEGIKSEESRSGNVMGADGSIFSIRRALYPDFPDTVLDDLTVSMAVIFAGRRLIKAGDVIARERLVSARSEEFRRKIRIAARAYHTHRHLAPQLARMSGLDKFKYLSHKMLRWFGGLFLGLGGLSGIALAWSLSWVMGLLGVALLIALVILAMRVSSGKLAAVTDIVLALLATQLGVFKAMRGQVVVTWSPAKTR
jgi:cellulose synthase/poly-beta-1,6-N-acetylglucosamine synthase-like glycosyltransferase